VLVATQDPARAVTLAAALSRRGLTAELSRVVPDPLDERHAALVVDGLETAATLRAMADAAARRPDLPILVVGPVEPDIEPLVALASGATGYLPATTTTADGLGAALISLLRGEVVLPPAIATALVHSLRRGARGVLLHRPDGATIELSHREWEILVLHRQGRTTADIATRLVVTRSTVRTHLSTISRKLGGSADGVAAVQ